MTDRLLTRVGVENLIGASRTRFYEIRKQGDFPAPVLIAPNAPRWKLSDVQAWIASRPQG